jgi:hypothetical protein
MRIKTYSNCNIIDILPNISLWHDKFLDTGKLSQLSLDIGWLKWGISIIFVDK